MYAFTNLTVEASEGQAKSKTFLARVKVGSSARRLRHYWLETSLLASILALGDPHRFYIENYLFMSLFNSVYA